MRQRSVASLRKLAALCRKRAGLLSEPDAVAALLEMAEEFDEMALAISQ